MRSLRKDIILVFHRVATLLDHLPCLNPILNSLYRGLESALRQLGDDEGKAGGEGAEAVEGGVGDGGGGEGGGAAGDARRAGEPFGGAADVVGEPGGEAEVVVVAGDLAGVAAEGGLEEGNVGVGGADEEVGGEVGEPVVGFGDGGRGAEGD